MGRPKKLNESNPGRTMNPVRPRRGETWEEKDRRVEREYKERLERMILEGELQCKAREGPVGPGMKGFIAEDGYCVAWHVDERREPGHIGMWEDITRPRIVTEYIHGKAHGRDLAWLYGLRPETNSVLFILHGREKDAIPRMQNHDMMKMIVSRFSGIGPDTTVIVQFVHRKKGWVRYRSRADDLRDWEFFWDESMRKPRWEDAELNPRDTIKTEKLRLGRRLYHGTQSPDEFVIPEGPAWFSDAKDVALRFVGFHEWGRGREMRPRVMTYKVTTPPLLIRIDNEQQLSELLEQHGIDITSVSEADALTGLVGSGYDGWIIPDNYGEGKADIMLLRPRDHLSLVEEVLLIEPQKRDTDIIVDLWTRTGELEPKIFTAESVASDSDYWYDARTSVIEGHEKPRYENPPDKEEPNEPRLALELLCGSSDVDPEHDGYTEPSGDLHPKHAEVKKWAEKAGMAHFIEANIQDETTYSDAYLYFDPDEIEKVASVLKKIGIPGDILDIRGRLSTEERKLVDTVASREGWSVESMNPPPKRFWGRAGAGILFRCTADDTYLLVLRSAQVQQPSTLGIPGGSCSGEDFFTGKEGKQIGEAQAWVCAMRETKEELSWWPKQKQVAAVVLFQKANFQYQTFIVDIPASEKAEAERSIKLNWENDEFLWMSLAEMAEAREQLHFGLQYVLDQIGG